MTRAVPFVSMLDIATVLRLMPERQEVLAVINACFDASFTEPKGITAIGGYVGLEDNWSALERAWIENLNMWRLNNFHLAELKWQVGTNADLCALSFARLLSDSGLHGVSAGLNDADWAIERAAEHHLPDKYVFCLEMLFGALADHARLEFNDRPVHVFLDRDAADHVIHDTFKRCAPASWSLTISDRRAVKGLQCADLSAGHWRLEWLRDEFGNGHQFDMTQRVLAHALAERSRGVFWSHKTASQVEAALAASRMKGN